MAGRWYADGLRFECTQCGDCCRGESGYVWVTPAELARLAEAVREPIDVVTAYYSYDAGRGRSLREKANGDCVFWQDGVGCSVYEARPDQCRTWPFWESNVKSPAAWERTKQACPGSGVGPLFSEADILARVRTVKV